MYTHVLCSRPVFHTAGGQAADLLGLLTDATSDVKSQAAHTVHAFVKPHHPRAPSMPPLPTCTPITKLRLVVLGEQIQPLALSLSLPCGRQYGLARSSPCPEEVGTHWQPSCHSPSHPRTCIWRHTNTETHKLVDRLTAPARTTPHPAGRWPMDRGHVAGRNASRCWALAPTDLVPVCLPANYQPGTAHKNREGVLFSPFWLQQSPCSQLLSASGHCCLFSWHFLSPMAGVAYRMCYSFYSWCCFCCGFSRWPSPHFLLREEEVFLSLQPFTVYKYT